MCSEFTLHEELDSSEALVTATVDNVSGDISGLSLSASGTSGFIPFTVPSSMSVSKPKGDGRRGKRFMSSCLCLSLVMRKIRCISIHVIIVSDQPEAVHTAKIGVAEGLRLASPGPHVLLCVEMRDRQGGEISVALGTCNATTEVEYNWSRGAGDGDRLSYLPVYADKYCRM